MVSMVGVWGIPGYRAQWVAEVLMAFTLSNHFTIGMS